MFTVTFRAVTYPLYIRKFVKILSMSTYYAFILGFVELGDTNDEFLQPNLWLDINNWLW